MFEKEQLTLLGSSKEVDTSLTLSLPNSNKKPMKNVEKNKSHLKSKHVQIDEYSMESRLKRVVECLT